MDRLITHARVVVLVVALVGPAAAAVRHSHRDAVALEQSRVRAPAYAVDPLWPKPLPNHWILGSVTGVAVDRRDRIWLVHRGLDSLNLRTEAGLAATPPGAEDCCLPAPPVLQFDADGTLVAHWGGPGQGYDWPQSPGGITVDANGNGWIAAAGTAPAAGRAGTAPPPPRPVDAHVLKFSPKGDFLLQIGKAGQPGNNASTSLLHRPAHLDVDTTANEVYVADGFVNRRIVVFDATTGAYKRHWGAYGAPPSDADPGPYDPSAPPARQFRTVSCVKASNDGMLYVCDRQNNRIQVFRRDGTFVKEAVVSKTTTGDGSVWDLAFSTDPRQQFVFVADGQDKKVFVLQRDTLDVVASFGTGGRQPGQFYGVGSVAVDSRGNVYTGETYEGKRLQKFVRR